MCGATTQHLCQHATTQNLQWKSAMSSEMQYRLQSAIFVIFKYILVALKIVESLQTNLTDNLPESHNLSQI